MASSFAEDKRAAHSQRLDRARELLSYVTVVVVEKPVRISSVLYVRDPRAQADQQGYVALTSRDIARNDAEEILLAEFARIIGNINRARGVALLLDQRFPGIVDELERLLEQVTTTRERIEAPPAQRRVQQEENRAATR